MAALYLCFSCISTLILKQPEGKGCYVYKAAAARVQTLEGVSVGCVNVVGTVWRQTGSGDRDRWPICCQTSKGQRQVLWH